MGKKNNKQDSSFLFDEYYSEIWKNRWPRLKEALKEEKNTQVSINETNPPYWLDEASLLTASLLPVSPSSAVLDMCAAPGGKSLVLAKATGKNGFLTANDRSPDRRERLRKVLYSLREDIRPEIRITGFNAESWGLYEKDAYDYVLLDAPCSSERHVLNDEKYLSQWSPSRPKRLAVSQYAMLSSALMAVKVGGYILYSTCSINPGENEEVIQKLFKRHPWEVEESPDIPSWAERRKHGAMVLPDTSGGKGPMYFCLLKKVENEK